MEAMRQSIDSCQPGMARKTTWSITEREECLLKARRVPRGWKIYDPVVFLVGRWGCGKTTVRNLLVGINGKSKDADQDKALVYPLSKFSTYYRPDEEKVFRPQVWETVARTGQLFDEDSGKLEDVPLLSAPFVGLNPPYPEWDYHGERFHIRPPSRNELRKVKDHLFSGYMVEVLEGHLRIARKLGKVPMIDCSPLRAYDLLGWFPNAVVVQFEVDDDILVERLRCRDHMLQTVIDARILEALSTPDLDLGPALRLTNNYFRQIRKNEVVLREFLHDSFGR